MNYVQHLDRMHTEALEGRKAAQHAAEAAVAGAVAGIVALDSDASAARAGELAAVAVLAFRERLARP
ncbi:hypothetical protein [Paludisphaera sp.]|uniref:hypothetical protein n=1 Tax=Paludisphaera sp. TaxID=2017432 RepID=UPI00301CF6EA